MGLVSATRTRRVKPRGGAPESLLLARAKLSTVLANVFQELRMGATLTDGRTWSPVFGMQNVVSVELANRVEGRRDPHNARSIATARREHRTVIAQHAGFHDLYSPIGRDAELLLVTGPFLSVVPAAPR